MKKCPLTLVGAFFVLWVIIIMMVTKAQKEPETKTATTTEERTTKVARPHTNKPSLQEIVVVEYSTKAFLNEGAPETEQ